MPAQACVVMSLSRMASVDYLVDHVANGDGRASEVGASSLTRYYAAAGYPPGTWLGSGLAALGGADMVGSEVTEDQLRELFEQSHSPFGGQQLGRPPAKRMGHPGCRAGVGPRRGFPGPGQEELFSVRDITLSTAQLT